MAAVFLARSRESATASPFTDITRFNSTPGGRAAESGLQAGDVIIEVGNQAVTTPADVRKMIDEARSQSKRAILLRIKRGDAMSFVGIPVG